jgi:hypothetical protein
MRVKSPHAVSPRFPVQRSSEQGESAPKARQRCVADGKQVNIPAPSYDAMGGRIAEGCPAGVGMSRFKPVEVLRQIRARIQGWDERLVRSNRKWFQEKPLSFSHTRPYRKPTQVGEMSILRRLRELGRRNSANWYRNFGRRYALVA